MTLLRQLIIVIVTLFLLLFAGTFAINVNNTRDFLNTQLQTISQDMATSLGLTMSPHMVNREMVVIESMVDAVFDSGYYREVTVLDNDGHPVIQRTQTIAREMAPAWFVKLIPLETPKAEGLIMNGWQQGGAVRISANPGFAYATLWTNAVHDFFWFLGASIVLLLFGMLALYYTLRPLRAVETQARAICEREYPIQTHLPWTRELRSVVEAMNLMSVKVREMFSEQSATLERLRNDAYRDALTGVANRSYFEMQLRYLIESEDEFGNGALIFLEVGSIIAINERLGYQRGDALLRGVADVIQATMERSDITESVIARLSGPSFAVIITDISQEDAVRFVTDLSCALPELQYKGLTDTGDVGHIGLAMYRGQSFSQFMSEADMALRAAQIKGINATHQHDPHLLGAFGALSGAQWISLLKKTLEQRKFTLALQAVARAQETTDLLHQEAFLRILGDDGQLIPASIFIPMVVRHGLTREFDRMVITEVVSRLKHDATGAGKVAINILPGSIADSGFVDWVCATLSEHPALAERIRFEISDYAVMRNMSAIQAWIRLIAPTGAKVGIDHFGKGFASVSHLGELRVEYIKIDGSFIRGIDGSKDNQSLVESLVNIAHGMDIRVIAESVEIQAELAMVRALRVDGVQGYGIKRPEIWAG